MAALSWDIPSKKRFEAGISHAVLYPEGQIGVAWNGLIGVTEKPVGGEAQSYYLDGIKYLALPTREELDATIEAYTYPSEFALCDGSVEVADGVSSGQQPRVPFSLCYRTEIGTPEAGLAYGYKLHILWNAMATPNDITYATMSDNLDAVVFSWELSTLPLDIPGFLPFVKMEIDCSKLTPIAVNNIETVLYGSNLTNPNLPSPQELIYLAGIGASPYPSNYLYPSNGLFPHS